MTHDSTVALQAPYSAKRKKTNIRVRPDLWEEFKKNTAQKHLSTCNVLEALMTAWLYSGSSVPGVNGHANITVNMQHVVERPRRREDEKYVRKEKTNHYDPYRGWYFDPELEPGEIVVEQPKEWGRNQCAEGFRWVESRRLWWKKE